MRARARRDCQVTLLMDTAANKALEDMPAYKDLLQAFITPEAGRPRPALSRLTVSLLSCRWRCP